MELHKLVVLAFITFSSSNGKAIKNSIKALEHLLINQKTSLTVDAFICWDSGEIRLQIFHSFILIVLPDYAIHLIRSLNELNFMVAINSFLIHQHNNFIVFDLACENAKQTMEQVKQIVELKRIVSGNCFQQSR
jgi:hypothetical protein